MDVYGFGVYVWFIDINEFVWLFLERMKFCYIKIYWYFNWLFLMF